MHISKNVPCKDTKIKQDKKIKVKKKNNKIIITIIIENG